VWRNQAPPAVGAKSPQCAALELWPSTVLHDEARANILD